MRAFSELLSGPRDIHVSAPGMSRFACNSATSLENMFKVRLVCATFKLVSISNLAGVQAPPAIAVVHLRVVRGSFRTHRYVH